MKYLLIVLLVLALPCNVWSKPKPKSKAEQLAVARALVATFKSHIECKPLPEASPPIFCATSANDSVLVFDSGNLTIMTIGKDHTIAPIGASCVILRVQSSDVSVAINGQMVFVPVLDLGSHETADVFCSRSK